MYVSIYLSIYLSIDYLSVAVLIQMPMLHKDVSWHHPFQWWCCLKKVWEFNARGCLKRGQRAPKTSLDRWFWRPSVQKSFGSRCGRPKWRPRAPLDAQNGGQGRQQEPHCRPDGPKGRQKGAPREPKGSPDEVKLVQNSLKTNMKKTISFFCDFGWFLNLKLNKNEWKFCLIMCHLRKGGTFKKPYKNHSKLHPTRPIY